MAGAYVELSENAFRSARVAVIAAAVAPIVLPVVLIAVRLAFGNTLPVLLMTTIVAGWCLFWGVLFLLFLGGLRDEERRRNRLPAIMYATGLWFASSLAAVFLSAVTIGYLEMG
jgi:hypothetical protein